MKAIFVHDHKFRDVKGQIYSPGGLSNEILFRYTQWFDEIVVVGRILHEDYVQETYSKIENSNISVVTNINLNSIINKADCVIARLPSINGYKAIMYAKKYKKPYLVEVVGCTLDAYWNHGLIGKVFALPAYIVMHYSVKKAPFALYVTSTFLQTRYPCKGKTVGISDVAIEISEREILVNRLRRINESKNRDNLVLGTAGVIDVEYKGQEFVIRAIPDLIKKTGKEIRYEIAGFGNPERLKKIAEECGVSDKVVFKGMIKHNEMFQWLDSIDIYIQPSLLEGLSRAIIEAMSRGLPCIAANKGGNPELIERKYLFSTKKKSMIAPEICERVIKIQNELKENAIRNYELSNNVYNRKVLNKQRDDFYKEFVAYTSASIR